MPFYKLTVYWKYFLLFFLLLNYSCQSTKNSGQENDLPNIIILLADDLGYSDLGCYGGIAQTPYLDHLAKEGIQFMDFYAAAPNCSPSRVGLLTGRSPSMVGMYNYMPMKHPMHLRSEEITIAEILKKKDYHTGHFGKWHISDLLSEQAQPVDQGFDYSLGTSNNAHPSHLNPVNFVRNGKEVGEIKGYSCQIIIEEALEWLGQIEKSDHPFFMYVAFHEPHKKVASPPDLIKKYSNHTKQEAEYFANIENLDRAIGNLLKNLKQNQLDKNTLILFASDNGSYRNGSNDPLLGGKSFVYEGGIRVPGILHWKDKIKGGQVSKEAVGLIDMMPTVCELSQVVHPQKADLDGTSLLPIIQQSHFQRQQPLSWFFYRTSPEIAMRIGDYTILGKDRDTIRLPHAITQPDMEYIKNMTIEDFEIYNVKTDIGQQHNIHYQNLDMGEHYKNQVVNRLKDIQQKGYYWNNLPPAKYTKKLKSEWRQLRPTGFGN